MTEDDFRKALAKAEDDKSRMEIITKQFNWSGIVSGRENTVAIYYIADALAKILANQSNLGKSDGN